MSLPVFKALKRLAMGDSVFPQQVTVGMRDPQCEITVWLHGLGDPRNVTNRHVMACADPLMIGVVFDPPWPVPTESAARLCLRFVERRGMQRLPGEIRLASIPDVVFRRAPAHLSLGFGLHACAGGALIRMAMAAVTSVFLARFGWLTLRGRLEWEGGSGFRTPRRLLVG